MMKKYFLFTFLLLTSSIVAFAQKIEATLLAKSALQKQVEALVILHEQADLRQAALFSSKEEKGNFVFSALQKQAENSQKNVLSFLKKENIEYRNFLIVNAIYIKTDIEKIRTIAKMPEVALVADNPWLHFEGAFSINPTNDGERAIEWGIQKIKADSVWLQGNKGEGVVIGGQDTGYQWDHPTLKKAYRGYIDSTNTNHNYAWHDAIHDKSPLSKDSLNPCGFNIKAPCDDNSHGTHTMGTMVGDDGLGNQIGVAPGASWIASRNMERGNGSPASYIESFEWFLAPTDLDNKNPNPKLAPHVINNSWYCSFEEGCTSDAISAMMEIAVKNLKAAGIVVVISAGNSGPTCATVSDNPGRFESAFTIGASDVDDNIGGFSSRGPKIYGNWKQAYIKPNVVAPGVNIRSSTPNNGFGAGWSGTSMAGPHVAGAVALVIAANPKIAGQVEAIENILESTATPLTTLDGCGGLKADTVPNYTFGFGRIDVLAAVKRAKSYGATNSKDLITSEIFSVYPNPVSKILNIEAKKMLHDVQIFVYDVTGKIVLEQKEKDINHIQLNISDLPISSYFYEIKSEKGISRGKFIKL